MCIHILCESSGMNLFQRKDAFHLVQCQLGITITSWGLLDFLKNGFYPFHVAFDAPTLMFH